MPYKAISGIYSIINTQTQKIYWGKSGSVNSRLNQHKQQLIRNVCSSDICNLIRGKYKSLKGWVLV